MDSYYIDNHKYWNMNPLLRRMIQTTTGLVFGPVVFALDRTGLYLRMQRSIQQRFAMNDMARGAFGDYQAKSGDVFVVTYPKSGTYWMIQIAYQIAHRGRGDYAHIHDVVPWPDGAPSVTAIPLDEESPRQQAAEGMRVIKTHLVLDALPQHPAARYVGVYRDPKEVFVSSYFFVRDVGLGPLMPSVNTWLELFLSEDFLLGSWAEHVANLWQNRHRDNLLLLSFHDMKADPAGSVAQVADFLRVDLTPQELAAVTQLSSFQHMQSIDHKFHPGPGAPFSPARTKIIRRGKSGNSAEMLSAAQQRRIDAYMQRELDRLGCDFPYEAAFGVGA